MRVLLLNTDSYGGHGGIALYNRDLAEALSMHPECEEVVVIPRVIRRAVTSIPPKVRFVEDAARGTRQYLAALARERHMSFDQVLCGHVNLLPLLRFFEAPATLFIYGIEAWKPLPRRNVDALQRCRKVVSISQVTMDRFTKWSGYDGPAAFLPNAIRSERYGLRRRRDDLQERWQLGGKRVLLTVGRVVAAERYKGFDEVIEILGDLPGDVVYVIAGGGNDMPRLREKAAACGVADRVRFIGDFDETDKADIYALSDVYVMPSRGEGFGFVFLEALASGLPCIGSKHDGGREALLNGGLGTLVDPSSPGEIRTAIMDHLTRTSPRLVPERLSAFSFERFTDRTAAILDAQESSR